ncbi:MAG: hypothetical protein ACXVMI_04715 [Flavisolibacter sp.]
MATAKKAAKKAELKKQLRKQLLRKQQKRPLKKAELRKQLRKNKTSVLKVIRVPGNRDFSFSAFSRKEELRSSRFSFPRTV